MRPKSMTILIVSFVLLVSQAAFSAPEYIAGVPMTQTVKVAKQTYTDTGVLKVPLITWGGDVATILARDSGIFKEEGFDVELFREDDFAKQVEGCLLGKTPLLRGTIGMINGAAEVCKNQGLDLVVIYQMTWSVGGDCMTAREGKNLKNINIVGLQLYGPHMDYAANSFETAGRLDQITFKWMKELTLPTYNTGGRTLDPPSAFPLDTNLDAIMCIIPDGLMLTSGGGPGTGGEGSVKGASIVHSTKTVDKVIADVYAVRSDYFDANRAKMQSFVKALLRGQEALEDLMNDKTQQAKYRQLLGNSADLLLGASQATGDVEALLADCHYVGYNGNIAYFTGKGGAYRTLTLMTNEIQKSFKTMGLMSSSVKLRSGNWDYSTLKSGLKYATATPPAPKPKFDVKKVQAKVEQQIQAEPTSWTEEGTLFNIEINFEPNQSDFPEAQYAKYYEEALKISQTYGGALIAVEGHSDPMGVLRAEKDNKSVGEIAELKQSAKNLSFQRANAVRASFISYCRGKNITVDESQFIALGLGIRLPLYNPPRNKDQWAANRRCVFRIKQVEAEMAEFIPLD